MTTDRPQVLVVDDERGLADLYSAWLEAEYDVETAYGGLAALELVDHETDVVLLDRRMPDMPGDEVLTELRSRDLSCHVAMVTAVEPDFDIVEMGFDDYVVKPVDRDELEALVERMLAMEDIDPGAQAYYSNVSKKTALESQKDGRSLDGNEAYAKLNRGIETYGSMVVSFAEDAIKANKRSFMARDQSEAKLRLKQWRRRLDSLDENDPLQRVAREKIEELEADIHDGGNGAETRFLEAVAEGFIAEGLWIDGRVKRALNLILYNRDRETFIINRQSLDDLAQNGSTSKFEVSEEVREIARKELRKRAGP